ncbi:Aminopeptidase 1 [Sparassis crispa]|uniref:Aminopeptidase n=1 Tax=Sparassis crispa TaxID=139825 RepID=A0A401GKD7_9APHY|nr:Aminopeptidase 1 [Sparassis crispa]GBE82604.1 Aminopeptidase 1 [Sparassis crispa]
MSTQPVLQDGYRLPTDVRPRHYDVTIRTDLEQLKFDGVVHVDLHIQRETSTVVLHVKDLKLGDVALYSEALRAEQTPSSSNIDTVSERAAFGFPSPLPAGSKAQLKIAFSGELTSGMTGYYRSTSGGEGKPKYYTLTQFESTYARKAFPCWDEPALKATFAVTLVSRADTVNLSNMPAISETTGEHAIAWLSKKFASVSEKPGDWKITRFETTPPMSTYIVAFANGHFAHLESSYTSPLTGKVRPLRIYTTPEAIDQAHFALEVKRKVLPLYEQMFEIEYPLPKLDTLVAHDFDSGAMENWGLITGRTTAFLLDSKKAELAARKRVATVQSHEVAHMWFGNITTMEWWDNLYLNEGFASLMGEVIILDKVFPEWKLYTSFITGDLSEALDLDGKLSSHPIEVECSDASMIDQIFDSLSYAKAASVLRMLSDYVGEERFLKGVSIYLKNHLYANSVTRDLWEGIQTATGRDIPRMMDNWVKKIGFPVLTVTEIADGIRVRQNRFLETGPAPPKDDETIWVIPLSLLTVSEQGDVVVQKNIVLDEREKFIPIDTRKPFKLNAGTVGVYRVHYTPERLVKIGNQAVMLPSPFSVEDRIGIVNDAFALAKAGFADVSSALSLVQVLRNEQEYLVWESVGRNLSEITSTWWEHPEVVDPLKKLRRELFVPIVQRLGYENAESDSVDTQQLRTLAIGHAASSGDEGVVEELTSRFARYLSTGDDSSIPADLMRVTYIAAVKYGGEKEWDAVKQIIAKPKTPTSGIAAIRALGATQDFALAEKTVRYTLTDARDQDLMYYFSGFGGNFKMRAFGKDAFKRHYETLLKRLSATTNFRFLVEVAFGSLSSRKDHDETVEFFKDKDTSKYDMMLKQALENMTTKAAWIDRSTGDILKWLEARSKDI